MTVSNWSTRFLIVTILLALVACGGPGQTPAPEATGPATTQSADAPQSDAEVRTITHAMGETEVQCTPQRVVTLGQGATDAALALDVTPVGAVDPWGEEWYDYLPDEIADVPSVGQETEPDLEAIVALDPDLIIGSRLRHEDLYDQLTGIAPTVFAETIGKAWKENFSLYAEALCREDEGAELIAAWDQRIADFQEKMGDRLGTEVSLVRFRSGEVRIYTTGFPGSVLREAGLSRPESQQVDDWETDPQVMVLNKEQIPLMDGDVMFYMVSNWGDDEGTEIQEEWTGHPLWQTLEVVQDDAVYPVNEEHWNLGGGLLAANRMLDDLYDIFLPDESPAPADAGADFPVTIEHKFGSTEITERPERVIALGYNEQDAILALGVKPIAVRYWFGDEPHAVFPWAQDELGDAEPEVLEMPFGELDFEKIAALQPDLISAVYAGITEDEYETLSQIAPTIAQTDEYVDFGMPWEEMTLTVGRALGRSDRAEELVADVEAQFAAVREQHPDWAGKTVVVGAPRDDTQFGFVASEDSRSRVFTSLGFEVPAEFDEIAGDQFWGTISLERIDLLEQDLLVFHQVQFVEGGRAAIEDNQLLQQLDAMQEGRVVFVEGELDDALQFGTVLSLPYLLDGLVPKIEAAMDGAAPADAGNAASSFPVTVEHKFGNTEISEEPERVLTVGYSEQDPILALGVTPKLSAAVDGDPATEVTP